MAAAIRGPSRRSSAATTRWPASIVRTCCRWASCTSCPSRATARTRSRWSIKDWQVNGIASWLSGTPFTIGGDNGLLQQQGGSQTINVTGEPKPGFGEAGPDEQWYDPARSPSPATPGGTPDATSSAGRGTGTSTSRCSVRSRSATTASEIRAESQNVFNHAQWGNPVTGFTDPNFMRIRSPGPCAAHDAARRALPVLVGAVREPPLLRLSRPEIRAGPEGRRGEREPVLPFSLFLCVISSGGHEWTNGSCSHVSSAFSRWGRPLARSRRRRRW